MAIEHMKKSNGGKGGVILNVSSVAGIWDFLINKYIITVVISMFTTYNINLTCFFLLSFQTYLAQVLFHLNPFLVILMQKEMSE